VSAVDEEPLDVERISWRRNRPQRWYDGWRNTHRILRYTGECVNCHRRTYAFDDGENDPRGVLGDRASHALVAEEFEEEGPDVPLCAICGNEQDAYERGVRVAKRLWKARTT
jgi:hypothetical protein